MYPCTGFIPAMLAMQKSYGMLKVGGIVSGGGCMLIAASQNEQSDLKACEGKTIKDFFAQVGLKAAFEYDQQIIEEQKRDVPADRYEKLSHNELF